MLQPPEMLNKIAQWRDKNSRGEMTLEDWKECFRTLRANRAAAQTASEAAKKSKARAKAPVDVGALKDSLKALKKF